jgi:hypothetical protein
MTYPRDARAPALLCRDAGSFCAGDECHRPSFWIGQGFRFQQAPPREKTVCSDTTLCPAHHFWPGPRLTEFHRLEAA